MMVDEQYLLLDAISHCGERRRKRIKGHFICINCDNQFIHHRPLKVCRCPVCFEEAKLCNTVDEFEIERIKMYSENTLITDDTEDDVILSYRMYYFDRTDKINSRSQRIKAYVKNVLKQKGESIEP